MAARAMRPAVMHTPGAASSSRTPRWWVLGQCERHGLSDHVRQRGGGHGGLRSGGDRSSMAGSASGRLGLSIDLGLAK